MMSTFCSKMHARDYQILTSSPCQPCGRFHSVQIQGEEFVAFCVQGWSKSPRPEGVTIAKPGHKPVFVPKLSLPAVGSPSDYGTSHFSPFIFTRRQLAAQQAPWDCLAASWAGDSLLPLCSVCCEHEVKRRS